MRNIRDGFLAEQDFVKLTTAAGTLSRAPLFIDDTSGLSILQLRAKAHRLQQQHGIKLFVVDYLQLLHSTARRAENRQPEIADISNGIKALAKELKVPIIVLASSIAISKKTKAANRTCPTSANPVLLSRTPTWSACYIAPTPKTPPNGAKARMMR